jgi:hypothetical protein
MKRLVYILLAVISVSSVLVACKEKEETYAEQKEREAKQIRKWLDTNNIDVITLTEFLEDTVTLNPDVNPESNRNEYVLFSDKGVYMQIVRRGEGHIIESDATWNMNARYVEVYVGSGDTLTMNLYQSVPDVFYVTRTGGNYTASFTSGIMATVYGNSVPSAWLMAMPYIKPGLLNGSSAAKIRMIVPHTEGTQAAATRVYPTFYEITLTKQKYN